tara:strand:- start:476 stop:892 length:417 start_codon:yes stop_codon:yes gene_type:complete
MDDVISQEEILLRNRYTAFIDQRKRSIGPEYYSNKDFWDRMWEREWVNLEEVKEIQNLEEIEVMPINHPTIKIDDEIYTIYTYSDFNMLHNQGIFREQVFLLDHTGKWKKNVIKELSDYGFSLRKIYKKNMLIMEVTE